MFGNDLRNLATPSRTREKFRLAGGAQVDGDPGYNFLRQFRLTIDFGASERIVGYNFLRHYKVAMDYPNESFSLYSRS